MLRQIAAAAIACLLLATPASPAVIHVDESGGGDYLTIQEGINAAGMGDTVLVAPGIYTGSQNRDLDFGGTNIVLRATSGPDSTIIDCEGLGRAFYFHSGEDSTAVVKGFTITHGFVPGEGQESCGGAIHCFESSPSLKGLLLVENETERYGGGIYCWSCSPTLTNVTFTGNHAYDGGGMYCDGSSPRLADTRFVANTSLSGAGLVCGTQSDARLFDVTFEANEADLWGGGISCGSSDPVLTRVTFVNNVATYGGGISSTWDATPIISHSSFWGNSANQGGALYCYNSSADLTNVTLSENAAYSGAGVFCQNSSPVLANAIIAFGVYGAAIDCDPLSVPTTTYSCIFGNAGGDSLCGSYHDNMFSDPLFCEGELTLGDDSPCLPENNVWGELVGAHGAGGCGPAATTWHVDCDNISGIEDGSEEHPFDAIGEGIAAASEGDTVLVAPGVYSGPRNRDLDFAGVNRILRSTAGPESTIVDCADSGRVFLFQSGEGPSSIVDGFTVSNTNPEIMGSGIYCQGSSPTLTNLVLCRTGGLYCNQASPSVSNTNFDTNYWYSGMRCVNNSSPTLTGVRFANNFDGGLVCIDSSPTLTDVVFEDQPDWGYAMQCTGNSDAVLTDVRFEHNDYGGLYCSGASPTLTNVTFHDNGYSESPAGGMCSDGGSPILANVTFTENHGEYAGGMACMPGCSASLTDVTFSRNSGSRAGGMYCEQSSPSVTGVDFDGNSGGLGGGIYCFHGAHPVLNNVTISKSEGPGMSCALWCSPVLTNVVVDSSRLYGLCCEDSCDVSLTNVTISGNQDCGMVVSRSSATLTDVIFSGNHSAGDGGGLRCVVADVALTDVTFDGNSSDAQGGGLFATGFWFSGGTTLTLDGITFSENSAAAGGAMFLGYYSRGSMTSSTLSENAAALGGGIHCASVGFGITNTIIAFNSQGEGIYCYDAGSCTPTITHSCIFGNAGGDSLCGDYYDNMFLDPRFCGNELTLHDDSPCLPENNAWGEFVGAYPQGCGATSVEGSFYADATSPESVILRWTVATLSGIEWFSVYRATSPEGPFAKVNAEPIPPASPGEYEDCTVWSETTFWYELRAALAEGIEDVVGPALAKVTTGGQLAFAAYPAIPNPFAAETRITLDIPEHAGPVSLTIYNARGQVVRTLIDGIVDRGRHTLTWDGTDSAGQRVSTGVYFARLVLGDRARSQKLVVLR